jgi:hypothetical protein
VLDDVLLDLALLDGLLTGQVHVDVLARSRRTGHVEAGEVAALAAPPAGLGSGKGHGHTRTLGPPADTTVS